MKTTQPPIEKTCSKYKVRKLYVEFEIDNKAKDKRSSICKKCSSEKEDKENINKSCICNCNNCVDSEYVRIL